MLPSTELVRANPSRTVPSSSQPRDIAQQAEERLRGNSYLALRNISCEYREGVLTLRGRLPSYYLKQIAQNLVAELDSVHTLVNAIDIAIPVQCSPG